MLAVVPIVLLACCALLLAMNTDVSVFVAVNGAGRSFPSGFWDNVTLFGNGLLTAALCAIWLRRHPQSVWATLLGAIPAGILTRSLKSFFDSPRPPAVLRSVVHVIGPAYQQTSFPSGDAITVFLLAAIAYHTYENVRVRALILSGAGLIALSRIMVGVHWPTDVLAGGAMGWFSGCLGVAAARRWGVNPLGRRLLAVFIAICAAALLFMHTGLPLADPLRWIVAAIGLLLSGSALARRSVGETQQSDVFGLTMDEGTLATGLFSWALVSPFVGMVYGTVIAACAAIAVQVHVQKHAHLDA